MAKSNNQVFGTTLVIVCCNFELQNLPLTKFLWYLKGTRFPMPWTNSIFLSMHCFFKLANCLWELWFKKIKPVFKENVILNNNVWQKWKSLVYIWIFRTPMRWTKLKSFCRTASISFGVLYEVTVRIQFSSYGKIRRWTSVCILTTGTSWYFQSIKIVMQKAKSKLIWLFSPLNWKNVDWDLNQKRAEPGLVWSQKLR